MLTHLAAEDILTDAGRWVLPILALDVHHIALGKLSLGLPDPFPMPC